MTSDQPVGTDPALFREMVGRLPIRHDDFVFIDFGSGKGRCLLLATEWPFRRIVGVELSAELNHVAREKHPALTDRKLHVGKMAGALIDAGKVTPLVIAAPTSFSNGPWDGFNLGAFVDEVVKHELAHMFWEKFVKRVYRTLRSYIRERQRDGAMKNIEPLVVVRAFIGMIIHHSLNNNLWDRKQQLLKISNQAAAREFTNILLHGVASRPRNGGNRKVTQRRKRSNK